MASSPARAGVPSTDRGPIDSADVNDLKQDCTHYSHNGPEALGWGCPNDNSKGAQWPGSEPASTPSGSRTRSEATTSWRSGHRSVALPFGAPFARPAPTRAGLERGPRTPRRGTTDQHIGGARHGRRTPRQRPDASGALRRPDPSGNGPSPALERPIDTLLAAGYRECGRGCHPVTSPEEHEDRGSFEGHLDALRTRLVSLSDHVLAAGEPTPSVTELLGELSAALQALEASAAQSRARHEALVEAHQHLDVEMARYRELFDLAPDGYLLTDMNGLIVEANRAAYGYTTISAWRSPGAMRVRSRSKPASLPPMPARFRRGCISAQAPPRAASRATSGASSPTSAPWLRHEVPWKPHCRVRTRRPRHCARQTAQKTSSCSRHCTTSTPRWPP